MLDDATLLYLAGRHTALNVVPLHQESRATAGDLRFDRPYIPSRQALYTEQLDVLGAAATQMAPKP